MMLKSDMDVDNFKGQIYSGLQFLFQCGFSILGIQHLLIKDKAQADIKDKNEYSSVLFKCN